MQSYFENEYLFYGMEWKDLIWHKSSLLPNMFLKVLCRNVSSMSEPAET